MTGGSRAEFENRGVQQSMCDLGEDYLRVLLCQANVIEKII